VRGGEQDGRKGLRGERTNCEALDCFILGGATSAVGAADGLDVPAAVLVTSVIPVHKLGSPFFLLQGYPGQLPSLDGHGGSWSVERVRDGEV